MIPIDPPDGDHVHLSTATAADEDRELIEQAVLWSLRSSSADPHDRREPDTMRLRPQTPGLPLSPTERVLAGFALGMAIANAVILVGRLWP